MNPTITKIIICAITSVCMSCFYSCDEDDIINKNHDERLEHEMFCDIDYSPANDITVIPTECDGEIILLPQCKVGAFAEEPPLALFIEKVMLLDNEYRRTFKPELYLNRPITVSGLVKIFDIPTELTINGETSLYNKHYFVVTDFRYDTK